MVDVSAVIDVVDVPVVFDVPAARDVVDVAPTDAGPCAPTARITAPLPNERLIGQNLVVRYESSGNAPTVLLRLGIRCDGVTTSTAGVNGIGRFFAQNSGYFCVALQQMDGNGRACQTPWRRVAVVSSFLSRDATRAGLWPDFDNDGFADMLMGTSTAMFVQRYQNTGTFGSGASPAIPTNARSLEALAAVSDVDGDGYGDAAATFILSGSVRALFFYRGGAMGLTAPPVLLASTSLAGDPTWGREIYRLGDRDGDGRAEIGVLALDRRAILVFGSSDGGAPTLRTTHSVLAAIDAVASGADLDGDGAHDFVVGYGGNVRVFARSTEYVVAPPMPQQRTGFGAILATGSDVDGDGLSELAARLPDSDELCLYRFNGAGFAPLNGARQGVNVGSTVLMPGDLETVALDEVLVFDGPSAMRIRRGGFTNDVSATVVAAPPFGVLVAGTSAMNPTGLVWFPRSANLAQHGIAWVTMNGPTIITQAASTLYGEAITLVAR